MGVVKLSTAGILNFQKYSSMRAGIPLPPPPPAFDLLETQVLSASTGSVTFSSLNTFAADYTHLQIRYLARSTRGDVDSVFRMRFNGDTGANYNAHFIGANGSALLSEDNTGASSSGIWMGYSVSGANATANFFAGGIIDITDPFNPNKNTITRTFIGQPNPSYMRMALHSGLWRNTTPITSVSLVDVFGNVVAGSRFSLYGRRA